MGALGQIPAFVCVCGGSVGGWGGGRGKEKNCALCSEIIKIEILVIASHILQDFMRVGRFALLSAFG